MIDFILRISGDVKSAADWFGILSTEIEFHLKNGNPFDNTLIPQLIWDYICGNY